MRSRCFDCKEFLKGTDELRSELNQEVIKLKVEINKIKIKLSKNVYVNPGQKKQDIELLKIKQSQLMILCLRLSKINELVKRYNTLSFERCFVDVAKNILSEDLFNKLSEETRKLQNKNQEELDVFMSENHFEKNNSGITFPTTDSYSPVEITYLMREPVGVGDKSKV